MNKKLVSFRFEKALIRLVDLLAALEQTTRTGIVLKGIDDVLSNRIDSLYAALKLADEYHNRKYTESEIEKVRRLYASKHVTQDDLASFYIFKTLREKHYPVLFAERVSSLSKQEIEELKNFVGAYRAKLLLEDAIRREAEKI